MELIKIGKVLKTHGYKGHLKIFIEEFYMNDFGDMSAIFINQLPYFIQSKDINSNTQAIILLEDIDNKEKAHPLQNTTIFAKEDDITEIYVEESYDDFVGFTISDKTLGLIGEIAQVIELPHQFLAQVFIEKKEILIPLNEDFILKIDENKKTIDMQLPDGLLDIF